MTPLLMFQTDMTIDWTQFGVAGGVIFIVVVFLIFLLKALPTYKEIKNREFDVRTEEAKVTGQISTALLQSATAQSQLAGSLEALGSTISTVVVEQRKTTDNLIILQRSTASETDNLFDTVGVVVERMDSLEEAIKDNGINVSNRPKAITAKRN